MHIPYCHLPNRFIQLMRINMHTRENMSELINNFFVDNQALFEIFKTHFKETENTSSVTQMIKSLGWLGLRDRLTNVYLNYFSKGSYNLPVFESYISDILKLEEDLKYKTVEGYSRSFLLGMYLKACELNCSLENRYHLDQLNKDKLLKKILTNMSSRVIKIDWLILQSFLLVDLLGEETFFNELSENGNFEKLYGYLSFDKKQEFMSSLLSYAASIGESEMFTEKLV